MVEVTPPVVAALVSLVNSGVLLKLVAYFLRIERRLMALEVRLNRHMDLEEGKRDAS